MTGSAPGGLLVQALCIAATLAATMPAAGWASAAPGLRQLRGVKRILFLGDSITYAGGYVETVDRSLFERYPDRRYELINAGLPSETVSGLTEPGHAGGAFPRPDLAERLDRALAKTAPQLIVACYGMNDGIYYPFDAGRFARFRAGIERLRSAAARCGARLWLMTPPPFDPQPIRDRLAPADASPYPPGGMSATYDEVLTRYARWLLEKRHSGWLVIDIHGPIASYLAERRRSAPEFSLAADGVHLNEIGHRLIAREILRAWGAAEAELPPVEDPSSQTEAGRALAELIHERQRILTDAWLTAIGHRRPGMPQGLALDVAVARAAELEARIRARIAAR